MTVLSVTTPELRSIHWHNREDGSGFALEQILQAPSSSSISWLWERMSSFSPPQKKEKEKEKSQPPNSCMLGLTLHPQRQSQHILDFIRKITLLTRRRIDDEEHTGPQFPSCRGKQLCGLSKLQEMAQQAQDREGHQQQRCDSWSWRSGLSLKPRYTHSGWCLGSILLMLTSLHKLGVLPILFYWSVTSILKAHELPMILLVVHISCRPYVWYLLRKAEVKKISIPFEVRDGKSSENDLTRSSSVKSNAEVRFDSWLSEM